MAASITGAIWQAKGQADEGIVFPTRRRLYACEGDYVRVPEPLLVKIDMGDISLVER